jgi:capsule polysaccharide export protein KpsE/RkpR
MMQSRGLFLSVISTLMALAAHAQTPQTAIESGSNSPYMLRGTLARQIAVIESQLLELRKVYTENYPGVRRLEIQLQVLRTQHDVPSKIDDPAALVSESKGTLTRQIAVIESHLIELRKVYTENYPDIRRLETQLQTLRDQDKVLAK